MEWWIWISWWFLFCFRYSRLYRVHYGKHETLTPITPIDVYINRINKTLVLKIKVRYNLELETPEAIIWLHKKLNEQNKKMEKT